MANQLVTAFCGIDVDRSGLGTANTVTVDRASGKSAREENGCRAAINHQAEK